jgi:hypothetical protein
MRQVIYAMQFAGRATPAGPDGNVLRASTTAPSTAVTCRVGADGLAGTVEAVPGGADVFASEVTFTSATDFLETGTITFGGKHCLRFSTVGSGYLGPSADPALKHGTVMWRVDGGEGQFAGASGLITSNFFVGVDLAVTDNHFGVLFVLYHTFGLCIYAGRTTRLVPTCGDLHQRNPTTVRCARGPGSACRRHQTGPQETGGHGHDPQRDRQLDGDAA